MNNVELIIKLVDGAYENLKSEPVQEYKLKMSSFQFRNEWGTVQIKLHRAAGHTTTALELLKKYPSAYLFVPSFVQFGHLLNYCGKNSQVSYMATDKHDGVRYMYHKFFSGEKIPLVILDNYSFYTKKTDTDFVEEFLHTVNSNYDLLVLLE